MGLGLYLVCMTVGSIVLASNWWLTLSGASGAAGHLAIVVALAFVPLVAYAAVPLLLDRYDPEPWWTLAMAFGWGAVVATSSAGVVNSIAQALFGETFAAVVSAPVSEELAKGAIVLGFFLFVRREFDGVVDGVVYAIFCALGFAAVENVQYYFQSLHSGQLGTTFFLRGLIAPWGHPLYTSMTGLGLGVAREARGPMRLFAPLLGLAGAMGLHSAWNFFCVLGAAALFTSLVFWALFLGAFGLLLVALVRRRGRIVRDFLRDEVLAGQVSREEAELAGSAFGAHRAESVLGGPSGKLVVRGAARLAIRKWHEARARGGKRGPISGDGFAALREEIASHRRALRPRSR